MKLEGTQTIKAPRALLFQLMTDPEVLKRCVPGCQSLEAGEDGSYKMILKAGVGSIKGVFTGAIRLDEIREPEHYLMLVDGRGSAGFVKGGGSLDLAEQGEETMIHYSGEISVGGTIASVGQRMTQSAAKMMARDFFTSIEAEAKAALEAEEEGTPLETPKHGFIRNTIRRLKG